MQMLRIYVCYTCADARHMDMPHLYTFLSFSAEIRKKVVPDLPEPHRRAAAAAGHILWSLSLFRRGDTPYVVFYPVPEDRVLHTEKRRFAYFPAVVHFRQLRNSVKIGSHRNGHPLI